MSTTLTLMILQNKFASTASRRVTSLATTKTAPSMMLVVGETKVDVVDVGFTDAISAIRAMSRPLKMSLFWPKRRR